MGCLQEMAVGGDTETAHAEQWCSMLNSTLHKGSKMLKTQAYDHPLQPTVNAYAKLIWDTALVMMEGNLTETDPIVPRLISIGFLISGYARNPAHYVPGEKENLIITNLMFDKHTPNLNDWHNLIIHELCHWLQHRLRNYRDTRDTHTHISWSTACWVAAHAVTGGEFDKPMDYYRPIKSVRIDKKIRKRQRDGSLTLVELHHFPDCLPPHLVAQFGM